MTSSPALWVRGDPWGRAHLVRKVRGQIVRLGCGRKMDAGLLEDLPEEPPPSDQCRQCRRAASGGGVPRRGDGTAAPPARPR